MAESFTRDEETLAQQVLMRADQIFDELVVAPRNQHCPRYTLQMRSLVMALRESLQPRPEAGYRVVVEREDGE